MTFRHIAAFVLASMCLAACASPAHRAQSNDLAVLADAMTGTFTSVEQAVRQPDDFLEVSLVMVPIWTDRADGPWLYVEQAMVAALDRPYRQRVYRLVDLLDGARSDVFSLPGEPLDYAGAWAEPARFDGMSPGDLAPRTGCSIFLMREGDVFAGSTITGTCESSLGGASYATSDVVVSDGRITSWDRGYDATDEQVWGAEAGPYEFVRVTP